jgi:hypothetical protein
MTHLAVVADEARPRHSHDRQPPGTSKSLAKPALGEHRNDPAPCAGRSVRPALAQAQPRNEWNSPSGSSCLGTNGSNP